MLAWSDYSAPLIGRILVGGFFFLSGILNVLNFSAANSALGGTTPSMLLVGIVIAIQLVFGLALIVDWKTRLSAIILAIYMITSTILLHSDFTSSGELSAFLTNVAIIGGLFYMSAYGSGFWNSEKQD